MKPAHALAALVLMACSHRTAASPPSASVRPTAPAFAGDLPLQMTLRGSAYSGTMTLQQRGDSVSGSFRVVGPGTVSGTTKGHVTPVEVQLELAYSVTENGCKGSLRMVGPIGAIGSATGTVEAQDSCVGRMTGTFTLGERR